MVMISLKKWKIPNTNFPLQRPHSAVGGNAHYNALDSNSFGIFHSLIIIREVLILRLVNIRSTIGMDFMMHALGWISWNMPWDGFPDTSLGMDFGYTSLLLVVYIDTWFPFNTIQESPMSINKPPSTITPGDKISKKLQGADKERSLFPNILTEILRFY